MYRMFFFSSTKNSFNSLVFKLPYYRSNRSFTKTHIRCSFFERDRRGVEYPVFPGDIDWRIHIRDGRKIFINECKLFIEEVKEHFRNDPKSYSDGDTDVFFRFDTADCLNKWRLGCDKDHNEGSSECSLAVNDYGKAIFSGIIDTTPPKDGKVRYAGYCAMRSIRKTKSFLRDDCFDWGQFTHLEMRVRGDGRNYMISLGLGLYFDLTFFDLYTYNIYTHGGPYWQLIRIPFSKFYLTSKGRVQDKQCEIPLDKISTVGIMCAAVPGPFRLEIDYIGCHLDYSHKEKFAYELYNIPKEIVSG